MLPGLRSEAYTGAALPKSIHNDLPLSEKAASHPLPQKGGAPAASTTIRVPAIHARMPPGNEPVEEEEPSTLPAPLAPPLLLPDSSNNCRTSSIAMCVRAASGTRADMSWRLQGWSSPSVIND